MTVHYSKDHEWIEFAEEHEAATVGITLHAQDALGDVVFVDLPEVGKAFRQGEVAGVVESVKAAADIFMPVSGEVVEVNEALRNDPTITDVTITKACVDGEAEPTVLHDPEKVAQRAKFKTGTADKPAVPAS